MKTRTRTSMAVSVGVLAGLAGPVAAQDFPAEADWEEFHCGEAAMWDDPADEPTAIDERDVVGDELQPAGFHYADPDYAYLRLRLEEDPTDTNGDLLPFAWGFEFDTDGDDSNYEVLVLASGIDQSVTVFSNDVVTLDNDPTDPADDPPIAIYAWASNGRVVAAGSDFGGDPDTYLDMAVLWEDLVTAGMSPIAPIRTWAASSSQANTLDGDFACHDPANGDPVLDEIGSDEEDVSPDSDGDSFSDAEEEEAGTDPNDPESFPEDGGSGVTDLEGGGGCSLANGRAPSPWLALMLLFGATRIRWRRKPRRPPTGRGSRVPGPVQPSG